MSRLKAVISGAILSVLFISGVASAQTIGPFCWDATPPLRGTIEFTLTPAGENRFVMIGVFNNGESHALSGSFVINGPVGLYQFTVGPGPALAPQPTVLVGGRLELQFPGVSAAVCQHIPPTGACGTGVTIGLTFVSC